MVFITFSSINLALVSSEKSVFICDSQTAKKYHYTNDCRGLNACKACIKKISLEDAKKLKRSLCGWED
ncbi:MAG: hypothetical protein CMH15_08625 [Mesonia sp.]|nr:hypothetical protein [Mesonia sp.]MAQ41097.1 hypothetical protein [Mesonia sp.]